MDNPELEVILSRNPRKIMNKRESYLLYELGLFGNKPRTWKSYDEIIKSGWKGNVSIRGKKTLDRNDVPYNIPLGMVKEKIRELNQKGFYETDLAFNEAMPDDHLLIQGEVSLLDGWHPHALYYGTRCCGNP